MPGLSDVDPARSLVLSLMYCPRTDSRNWSRVIEADAMSSSDTPDHLVTRSTTRPFGLRFWSRMMVPSLSTIVTLAIDSPAVVYTISQSRAAMSNGSAPGGIRNCDVSRKETLWCSSSTVFSWKTCGPTVQPVAPSCIRQHVQVRERSEPGDRSCVSRVGSVVPQQLMINSGLWLTLLGHLQAAPMVYTSLRLFLRAFGETRERHSRGHFSRGSAVVGKMRE